MINVDLRRYGTDKEYELFINGYLAGADVDKVPAECQIVCSVKETLKGESNGIHED